MGSLLEGEMERMAFFFGKVEGGDMVVVVCCCG
jgi:hypothetical protein